MENSLLMATLLRCLAEENLVYQAGHTRESLALLAEIFSEDLADEKPEEVKRAFALHRKRSTRFPTPAHIIALLPECRLARRLDTLPEAAEERPSPEQARRYCAEIRAIIRKNRQGAKDGAAAEVEKTLAGMGVKLEEHGA